MPTKFVSGDRVMRRTGSTWVQWDPHTDRLRRAKSLVDVVEWLEDGATWYGDDLTNDNRRWLTAHRERVLSRARRALEDLLSSGCDVERVVAKVTVDNMIACLVAVYADREPVVLALGSPEQFAGAFDTPYVT